MRLVTESAIAIYYGLSVVIILPTFCGIVHIYINRITECKFLEDEFSKVQIDWRNKGIMKLSELKHLSSLLEKGTVRDRRLANTFSSFYLLNIMVYSTSYAFYLIIALQINYTDHWPTLALLLTSGITLFIFMAYTNWSGKKLKKQTAHIYCVNDCEEENNAEFVETDTTNLSALSKAIPLANIRDWETIVHQFDSYAKFFIFSSVPVQVLRYATGLVVPWVVMTILQAHGYSLRKEKTHIGGMF